MKIFTEMEEMFKQASGVKENSEFLNASVDNIQE